MTQLKQEYDVVVIGGGTAGVSAAIQAGRAGVRTLLVEKNAMLGGTMTVGGVNAPAQFFAWGQQITGGIGWELVRRTLEETGHPVPTPESSRDTIKPRHVTMDKVIFSALCDQAVVDANVDLLFHAMLASATFVDDMWILDICTKAGLRRTSANVLIDTTGDANVASLAGCEIVRPAVVQPATLKLSCSGYDIDALDFAALKASSEAAVENGELKTTDISWNNAGPEYFLRAHGGYSNHIRAPHAETSEGRSNAEIEARQSVLRLHRFFRRQPNLERFQVDWICSEVGIRETVTIKGKKTVKVEDYEAGKLYSDALCYACYPIDEHLNDGLGVHVRRLKPYVLPTIPRGAMLPMDSRFLIVAGRCVSSDREANSALRVECPCMAMGQAAGAMAVLSVQTGLDPEELPMNDIYELLRNHKAIIPGDIQPAKLGPKA